MARKVPEAIDKGTLSADKVKALQEQMTASGRMQRPPVKAAAVSLAVYPTCAIRLEIYHQQRQPPAGSQYNRQRQRGHEDCGQMRRRYRRICQVCRIAGHGIGRRSHAIRIGGAMGQYQTNMAHTMAFAPEVRLVNLPVWIRMR